MELLCIACMEERESVYKSILTIFSTLSLSSMRAMQVSPTLVPQSQQRLHNLQFLQKVGVQKLCWDQARLSSLVNKQVGPPEALALVELSNKSVYYKAL